MDLITIDTRSPEEEAETRARVDTLLEAYSKTETDQLNSYQPPKQKDNIGNLLAIGDKKKVKSEMKGIRKRGSDSSHKISPLYQTFLLVQRLSLNTLRDKPLVIGKLIEPILMGVVVALIFFQLGTTLQDISASIAAVYSAANLQPYLVLLASQVQSKYLLINIAFS